jgi:hypothetical protein
VGAAIIAIELVNSSAKQPKILHAGATVPKAKKAPKLALRPTPPKSRNEQLAERDAAQQNVFLREVDDALRQDEMLGVFQRYGKPIIAGVALGLAIFGGYLIWNNMQEREAGEHGEQLTLALDELDAGRIEPANKKFGGLAVDSTGGTKVVGQLMQAGIAQQQGRLADAVKGYAAVAADEAAPKPYRDLATLREVAANFDAMPPQQVIDRLKPLAVPGNAWFGSAGELVGAAYLKQNRGDMAGPLFAAIARDKDTPESLRNRARQMAGLLGVDAIDDAAKAAGGAQP